MQLVLKFNCAVVELGELLGVVPSQEKSETF
jgi:hypothetical protein